VKSAIFSLDELRSERERSDGRPYHEFLRIDPLSAGLYELAAGAEDLQQPHAEDELYYVVGGSARFEVEGERRPVGPGDVIFVAARVPHRFVEIERDLTLLVFFAPAETG
jgi:mannose-6-phosphate isomerase-like protein (cupin superfamily)